MTTIIKPKYKPKYPEYKGRCRMRCGDIWRCGGPKKKEKELLSYEELKELGWGNAIMTELNSAPERYFESLTDWLTWDDRRKIYDLAGGCLYFQGISYNPSGKIWVAFDCLI